MSACVTVMVIRKIRGFAGVRDPIVAEVPSIIMLHRNIDQHVCKAKCEARHTILVFLEINGNTERHHAIRGIALGCFLFTCGSLCDVSLLVSGWESFQSRQ